MDTEAYTGAQRLWDYMKLGQPAVSADLLLVLGSIDDRVAVYAAELSRTYDYGLVVFSGGIAHGEDLLRTAWDKSEAEHFFDVFMGSGGEARQILLETTAVNTGQNALLTYELLQSSAVKDPQSMKLLQSHTWSVVPSLRLRLNGQMIGSNFLLRLRVFRLQNI